MITNNIFPINSPGFYWYNFPGPGDYLCIVPDDGLKKLLSFQLNSEQSQRILGELLFRRWLYSGHSPRLFTSTIKSLIPLSLLKSFDTYVHSVRYTEIDTNALCSQCCKSSSSFLADAITGSAFVPEKAFARASERIKSFLNAHGYISVVTSNEEAILLPFLIKPGNPLITDINSIIIKGWVDDYKRVCEQFPDLNHYSIQIQCNLGERFTSKSYIDGPSFCLPVIVAYEREVNKRFGNIPVLSMISTGNIVGNNLKSVDGVREKQHLARKVEAQLFIAPTGSDAISDNASLFLRDGRNIYECIRQITDELENRKLIKWDWESASPRLGDSRARINNILSKGFTSRSEERIKVREFCQQNKGQRFFVSGSPGMGKSALMAQVVKEVVSGQTLEGEPCPRCPHVIAYFIGDNDPVKFSTTFRSQIDAIFPDVKYSHHEGIQLQTPEAEIYNLIQATNQRHPDERLILFLDGIDQCVDIIKCIPDDFPWRVIVSGCKTKETEKATREWEYQELELGRMDDASSKNMLAALLKSEPIAGLTDEWLNAAVKNADGLPVYLAALVRWVISQGKYTDLVHIPPSLEKMYEELVENISKKNQNTLCVIRLLSLTPDYASLTREILADYWKEDIVDVRVIVNDCAHVLDEDERHVLKLFHISFRDYVFHNLHAVQWLRELAEQGHAYAQYYLGNLYLDGRGVEKDLNACMQWYTKAIDQGFLTESLHCVVSRVRINIAILVKQFNHRRHPDECVALDEATIVQWYTCFAKRGDAQAQYKLGEMYAEGYGVKQSLEQALKWWRLAAEQGNEDAKAELIKYRRTEII